MSAETESTASARPLRVLALPAWRRRQLNPFQALLYDAIAAHEVEVFDWTFWRALWWRCDLWHLHHPDTVLFPRRRWQSVLETGLFRLLLSIARLRGIRIVWTVHDLDSSDGVHPHLEPWFWRYFVPRLDGYICLTEAGQRLALERFPGLGAHPGFIVPHGDFSPAYPNTLTRREARELLGIDQAAPLMLNYGLIRPYKDVPRLVETVAGLDGNDAQLLVAGRVVDASVREDILRGTGGESNRLSNVHLFLQWISFEDTQRYFLAADLVVLPYRRILNSGTLMLALAFERPVLVPDRGVMRELQSQFGDQWIRVYDGELDASTLRSALDWARHTPRDPPDFTALDWPTLAVQTRRVYDRILGSAELDTGGSVQSTCSSAPEPQHPVRQVSSSKHRLRATDRVS